eukprot:CAMPEP_0169456600 /NCGR_PEP_ID=MMETSP1042-20121227/16437_1 /TAXON_ID=464988 /ORGANISM="Hemiselmis andersenii, Strain CCMP1180" /LENGTH=793 /DNA_ID=CAMNT_0009568829 /DNA_START=817 /DNA_END=3197 /DNA_ORIENTATION=-
MPRDTERKEFLAAFGVSALQEPFNRTAVLYLQQHGFPETGGSDAEKKAVDRLLEASKGKDHISVTYKKGARSEEYGRWFAAGPVSMQSMPRRLRHTLCLGIWTDYDFVNCHPTIAVQLCRKMDVDCPHLERYISERDAMLAELLAAGVSDRDTAKQLIISCLNGSGGTASTQWWDGMKSEFRVIAAAIANHADNAPPPADVQGEVGHAKHQRQDDERCPQRDREQIPDNEHNRELLLLHGDRFLQDAVQHILETTGFKMGLKVKPFDEAYELPEGYRDKVSDISVIELGNDRAAADLFFKHFPERLVRSGNRYFWRTESGIYESELKLIKGCIMSSMRELHIYARTASDGIVPYSDNTGHIEDCTKMILSDGSIVDEGFVDKLWDSSIRHLPFDDGVYSFETGELLPYPVDGVYFTSKINRPFPLRDVSDDVVQQLMDRVIMPIFPDEDQREYFLHSVSRAMAGEIWDKKWYTGIGERNSGKGVFCTLLELAFGPFVNTINSENLLYTRMGNGDTAKKLSWMSPLEFKRIAYANEIQFQEGVTKLDGNMIKKMASGGDKVEVRTNYKDEEQKRLQTTTFLFANDFPQVSPADAYETLEVFQFKNVFMAADVMQEKGDRCPRNWVLQDTSIKNWIRVPEVIDAFTKLVLDAYKKERVSAPPCVKQDTLHFAGSSGEMMIDRVREVVSYVDNPGKPVFVKQISMALEKAGVVGLSTTKIRNYVEQLYCHEERSPVYKKYTIDGKRDMGFNRIRLNDIVAFNDRQERRNIIQREREELRNDVYMENLHKRQRTLDS